MLKLKNVSKFYYNKGVIASGFSKVSVEFKIGEFVAIVGESGSGKSTLLNVISGLDSYEEGEMYINGEETSHYREVEFENYRKKYVSNIFQNFNLVNSYTVYQNVELVLLLNGYKKKEIKDKVLEIIDKVRLTKYKNTKVSKLSGGQKQRVAIARALAKETPIIVCDEPTGNLDSRSAKEIIKLLKEISQDKLVIIVTHNFDQVEDLVTRVVRMHDGKIVSDKKLVETKKKNELKEFNDNKNIGLLNIIRLGFRNTFNIVPKFLLIFIVFLFITASLLTEYGSLKKSEYESSKQGYNYFFNDMTDTRIVINKKDGSPITEEDFGNIKGLNNVDYITKYDLLLDNHLWFETGDSNYLYFDGCLKDILTLTDKLDYGRMPEADNEVVVAIDKYNYYFSDMVEEVMNSTFYFNGDKNSFSVKVVGIIYLDSSMLGYTNNIIYGTSQFLDSYMILINSNYSSTTVNSNGKNYKNEFSIVPSDKISNGNAYIYEGFSYICKDYNCKNKTISISIDNLYYQDSLNLNISNVYTDKNVDKLLDISKDDDKFSSIFISVDDYNKLFNKDSYQASVFANRVDNVEDLAGELEQMGYNTLEIRKSMNSEGADIAKVLKIVKLVVVLVLVITLFFISYFVIKLILKSRQVYFSTLRILGATYKHIKRILDVELFVNASLAYLAYMGFVMLVKMDILSIEFIKNAIDYLKFSDYILMYVILVIMSYLISSRFSSKIFKKSAMKTYREEV